MRPWRELLLVIGALSLLGYVIFVAVVQLVVVLWIVNAIFRIN